MPVVTFAGVVVLTTLAFTTWQAKFSRNRSKAIPRPAGSWPLIGHLPMFLQFDKPVTETILPVLERFAKQYEAEGLFQLSLGPRNIVFLCNPHTMEQLLTSNVHISKGLEYELLARWLGNSILVSSGEM